MTKTKIVILLSSVLAWLCLFLISCSDSTLRPIVDKIDPEENTSNNVDTEDPPLRPVAHAGRNITVEPPVTVTLDGSLSYDPLGFYPLGYYWTFAQRPSSSQSIIHDGDTVNPSVWIDTEGMFVFELDVQNNIGTWSLVPNEVVVFSEKSQHDLKVVLTWNTGVDLDLHLAFDDEELYSVPYDCNYCNKRPVWGDPESELDNPVYTYDFTTGYGPEEIIIKEPARSTYRLTILRYSNGSCTGHLCQDTRATVIVYIGGTEIQRWSRIMPTNKEVWDIAYINWPEETIDEINYTYITPLWTCAY
jgi:hypothetical protein